jgi:hypothetical protein
MANFSISKTGPVIEAQGGAFNCLHCRKIVAVMRDFALAVVSETGELKGYVHPVGSCREMWLTEHPRDRCEQIIS